MTVTPRFDHVGVTVADLDGAIAFFESLGLELEGRSFVEGEFLDTVCGIAGARTEVAMLTLPGGGTRLEVCTFVRPDVRSGSAGDPANVVGLRNVCFEVDDLRGAVDRAAAQGYSLVGGIGEHEGIWAMAYVRGPEGITVSLTQSLR